MRPTFTIVFFLLAVCRPAAADLAQDSAQHGDIEVAVLLDAAEQSGSASASVRIHARREVVWSLITSCAEALQLVPGLVACEVMRNGAGPLLAKHPARAELFVVRAQADL